MGGLVLDCFGFMVLMWRFDANVLLLPCVVDEVGDRVFRGGL